MINVADTSTTENEWLSCEDHVLRFNTTAGAEAILSLSRHEVSEVNQHVLDH